MSTAASWLSVGLTIVALGAGQAPPAQVTMTSPSPDTKLAQLAIETAKGPAVTPIPLDTDGSRVHGVLYDRFLLGVLAARAAIAAGRTPPVDAPRPGAGLVPLTMVIVAYPLTCEGRTSAAEDVRLLTHASPAAGAPFETVRTISRGADAKALLPGVELPAGSLAVAFSNAGLYDASVMIDYADPVCPGAPKTAALSVRTTPARASRTVTTAQLPPDLATLPSPSPARVQVILDRDGALRLPSLIQGPQALETAALDAVSRWQFEPARINGVAVTQAIVLTIMFTTDGRPAPSPVVASSTGSPLRDPTHDTTTAAVPGLSRASSRCAISEDPTYGFATTNAIKVGGDSALGPSREVKYLNVLRGPNGESVRFRRLGSLPGADRSTILDLYELTYDGIDKPMRLYVDEYHFDELKAPMGLICAAAFDLVPPGAPPSPTSGTVISGVAADAGSAAATPLLSTPDVPNLTSASSQCPISEDETYGVTAANPIRIGGGADGPAREQQYLTVLRGPTGQGLRYRRMGSMLAADRVSMLDSYEVSYTGLPQRVRLYFDRSQADVPKAPKGWVCSAAIK
jgi:hypothetical protein